MLMIVSRVVAVAGALAIVGAGLAVFHKGDVADHAQASSPARDALVQAIDLTHIASFRYVDDYTLEVVDEKGGKFKMELTEPCPGLKDATDFSLVTESHQDFDRFTAIAVNGSVCSFKDFAPLPVGAPTTPAN